MRGRAGAAKRVTLRARASTPNRGIAPGPTACGPPACHRRAPLTAARAWRLAPNDPGHIIHFGNITTPSPTRGTMIPGPSGHGAGAVTPHGRGYFWTLLLAKGQAGKAAGCPPPTLPHFAFALPSSSLPASNHSIRPVSPPPPDSIRPTR